jgi:group I intron endonuclease
LIIYKATNLINGKVYIGLTKKKLEERIKEHIKESKAKRRNNFFYNAIRKYGIENFKWEIIDTALNYENLKIKEKYWIAEYKNTNELYNMTDGGDGRSNYKASEETKQKMRESRKNMSEETRRKMSEARKGKQKGKDNPMYGKKQSPEWIEMIKKVNRERVRTSEERKKLSDSLKGKPSKLKGVPRGEQTKINISLGHKRRLSEKTCNSGSSI